MEKIPTKTFEEVAKDPEKVENKAFEGVIIDAEKVENKTFEGVITDPEKIENKLKLIDRLVDWETSLTSRDKFRDLLLSGKQLRIKFGADITAPTLHIGHAVNLRVMRHMQDLGHKVVFLLGGFTTLVGDPTDKLQVRTAQEDSEVEKNKKLYIEQLKSVLIFNDPNLLETRDNTEWWGTLDEPGSIKVGDFFEMLKTLTVSSVLARDMFKKRTENNTPIYLSEFLYPVLQGYDSVVLESDITVVGSDQLFNEKMAWGFQEAAGQGKQAILCTIITPGLDGGAKQSKSIGNYVGLGHSPKEKFNRVMLLLDELIPQWFNVYTEIDKEQILKFKDEYSNDPISFKKRLAFYITEMYHGSNEAMDAEKDFENKKMMKRIPSEIPKTPISDAQSIDDILRKNFSQKSNNIKDLATANALAIITKVNEDGTYEEDLINDVMHAKNYKVKPGDIVRWGKNKFYKIV